jgi:DeoR/GlpR family transcriptional regulator of sugar metabolism
MIEGAASAVVVATSDKLGATAMHHVVPLRQIEQMVVEHDTDETLLKAFESSVAILRADSR